MSDTVIQHIIQCIEEHVPNYNQRKGLYESIIPTLYDYDPEVLESLCELDSAFFEEYKSYVDFEKSNFDEEYDD